MNLFERLKSDAAPQWADYTQHAFVEQLGTGKLPLACFKHYLVQDYLFLIQFARAYASGIYKSPTVADMRHSLEGVKAILDVELELHIEICGKWGMQREEIEKAPEDTPTMAYTRFVLDAGMAGDLLDLQAAHWHRVFWVMRKSARTCKGLAAIIPDNPYQRWIQEYAGEGIRNWRAGFEGLVRGDRRAGADRRAIPACPVTV